MRGEFSLYVNPGPEKTEEEARESLKSHKALTIDVSFDFFDFLGVYFQLFLVYLEK